MPMLMTWGIDVAALGGFAVYVDDASAPALISISTGTYAHGYRTWDNSDAPFVTGEYTEFADAVDLALNGLVSVSCSWSETNLAYTIAANSLGYFDFRDAATPDGVGSGSLAGKRLAAWLGFNYQHANATGGSAADPYNIKLSGEGSYVSNCRPYGILLPTIAARSEVSDEYEPEGLVQEVSADDGSAYYVAKDGAAIFYDWTQTAETDTPTATITGQGCALYKRSVTAINPWSYQHAWEYMRSGGSIPFSVKESGASTESIHQMRAEGLAFHPTRWASKDFALWSLAFRTRLLDYSYTVPT